LKNKKIEKFNIVANNWGKMTKTCFYFGEGRLFNLLCWGVPHVPK
jgi:hypothetical protein